MILEASISAPESSSRLDSPWRMDLQDASQPIWARPNIEAVPRPDTGLTVQVVLYYTLRTQLPVGCSYECRIHCSVGFQLNSIPCPKLGPAYPSAKSPAWLFWVAFPPNGTTRCRSVSALVFDGNERSRWRLLRGSRTWRTERMSVSLHAPATPRPRYALCLGACPC